MYYETFGQPSANLAVISLHGLLGSADNLGMINRELKLDRQVIAVDLPNHGQSPHGESMHYDDMADSVLALAEHLQLDSYAVLGHSMGGKVAMRMALKDVAALRALMVLDIAPVAYAPSHQTIFAALSALDVDRLQSRSAAQAILSPLLQDPALEQFLLKNLRREGEGFRWRLDLETIQRDYPLILDWPSLERQFFGPSLFVKGAQSDYISSANRAAITHYFPNARLKVIDGTGHWLHAQKPTTIVHLLQRFLDDVQGEERP